MRILLFSTAYLPFVGGAELAFKEITDRLPDIEFDLITAKLKKDLPETEKIGNVNVFRVGRGNFFDKILLPNLGFIKAIKLHKQRNYDLIHGIMASYGSGAAYFFRFFNSKTPFVLTLQEGDLDRNSYFDRFWQGRIIARADVLTAISGYLADFAKRSNKKVPIHIIPNGVGLEKIEGQEPEKSPEKKNTVITVSRLVRKNGVDLLIRAVKELKSLIPDSNFSVLIAGDGPERKRLEMLARNLGVENQIQFLGTVPNEKVSQCLNQAGVFVRPSRSEGLGTAFLEAMAAGIPVIATPVGGIPDFLKDPSTDPEQATGLFCKKENPSDLAEKITRILTDDNLRNGIIKNARMMVEKKYDWDKIAKDMRGVYENAINSNPGL